MTKNEYLRLVRSSNVFKDLAKGVQESILEAKGSEQMKFQQIFVTEKNGILSAKKMMIEKNSEVIKSFTVEVRTIKKEKLEEDELVSAKEDKNREKRLLDELNNI